MQYRRPTSSNLRAVRVSGPNAVIVAGDATAILRSDDGGQSWAQLEHTPFSRGGDVVSMDFFGVNLECVGIDSKDTTKGRVWTAINGVLDFVTPNVDSTVNPYVCVDVVSSDTSYRLRNDLVIEKSVAGVVTTPIPMLPAGTWTSIDFFGTTDTGFAVGYGFQIWKTTNASAWVQMTTPLSNTHQLRSVMFPTMTVGYACGDNISILKTTDGGATWTQQQPIPPTIVSAVAFHSIHFPVDVNNGWAVGDGGLIAHTVDGGTTWIAQVSPSAEDLYDVRFADNNNGYAVGNNGMVLRTSDGGVTATSWLRAPPVTGLLPDSLTQLNAVDFSNDGSIGLVVGNGGLILRTQDGGASWIPQSNSTLVDLFGVAIPKVGSGDVAYACGALGNILKTSNLKAASPTWTAQTPSANTLRAILFPLGDTTGAAVGDLGTALYTVDGSTWPGATFSPALVGTPSLQGLTWDLLMPTNFYLSGAAGTIRASTNFGQTWGAYVAPAGTGAVTFTSIQVPPTSYKAVVGDDGKFYRELAGLWTPAAGTTMQVGTVPQKISFLNSSYGWSINSPAPFTGGLFYTEDGGTSPWTRSYVHTKNQLRGIWMSPSIPGLGYVVGSNGTILKTTTGGK